MIVLGFDTATAGTAVGLRLADGTTLQAYDHPAPGERPGHATRLLPLANQLLLEAALGWDSLERIAVGVGPGTFTGLRVGVATARGLAQSLSLGLIGVSSLQALAQHAFQQGCQGPILAAIDARRGEVFAGGWAAAVDAGEVAAEESAPGEVAAGELATRKLAAGELFAARALAPEGLREMLSQHSRQDHESAPERSNWLAVGDGAVRFRSHFEDLEVEVPADTSPLHRIDGASICALAIDSEPNPPSEVVLPDYLRRPDAEIALQGAAG